VRALCQQVRQYRQAACEQVWPVYNTEKEAVE